MCAWAQVNPEELKSALFAFSHMGLIAETPKMQPLNQYNEPFVRAATDDGDDSPRGCCRKKRGARGDSSGGVPPFNSGEVMLVGEEGVPMTGCWGLDLEFQFHSPDSEVSFHCLVKSYAGDAIVARSHKAERKLTFFVAPKAAFLEQEAHVRLEQLFAELDEYRYLCEVELDKDADAAWYRLVVVGESTQASCEDPAVVWGGAAGDRTAMDGASFFNPATPGEAEIAPLIGASMAEARTAMMSPVSSIAASLRTPALASPRQSGGAMMRRTSLSERRGSFTLTPGMASARQRPRLMSQGGPSVTPVQRPKSRARSRRLSICNPESPAESDGWSDDEDVEKSFSATPSAQKLHVYLLKTDNDDSRSVSKSMVLADNVWQGQFNFLDCYTIGNHYDAVCCRADGHINWSVGGLRNFLLFGMDPHFMTELEAHASRSLTWLSKAIELASRHRDGRCMHDEAKDAGMVVRLAEEEEPSPITRNNRSRSNRGLLTPRGRPMRMSSRFVLSPRSPRSPFPFNSPGLVSPLPASPIAPARATRSSYQTLADKLKNSHGTRKEEKQAGVAIELGQQPHGTLLWMKYKLVTKRTVISCVEPEGHASKVSQRSGLVWNNSWERDLSPDFPFSTGLVYRDELDFLEEKARRTQRLVRAAYKALRDDHNQKERYWDVDEGDTDLLIDGAKFFLIRGDIARRDPGLNSMFTGKQVKHASKAVQRQMRVNTDALKSILGFFLLPLPELFRMLGVCRCCSRKQAEEEEDNLSSSYNVASRSILTYLFRTQRRTPRVSVVVATIVVWLCCLVPLCAYSMWDETKAGVHGIEIFVNTSYYMWAMLCMASVVASEIRGVPGRISYKQASLKSEIASKPSSLTKISDGMPITASAMAIVQMVCRQHQGDDEDEDEEEGEEEEAGMDFSSKLLKLFWQQDDATVSLPWLQGQMQHDEELSAMSHAQLNRLLVFEFQLKDPPRDKNDWIYNLNISVQGVQSKIDLGRPKTKAKVTVVVLALMHGSLGLLHRTAFRQLPALGDDIVESASAVGVCICTTVASYIVYSVLLQTGLKWWMVHLFLKQTHSAIVVEEAITAHLPCYLDLRSPGNLDSWYCARQYVQEETNASCFAHKDQLPIAVAMVMCAGLSVNALTTYFDAGAPVDFFGAPGILISLFNLVVIGVLLMIALMALEKINMETSVLLRKMNQVAVELGKSLEENVYERMSAEERTRAAANARAKVQLAAKAGTAEQMHARVAEMDTVITELQVRERLMMEQQFLLSIVQELRDTKSTKKIFGFAVDRQMLTKLFAGIGTCIYIILKEYFAALLPGLATASGQNGSEAA